MYQVAALGALLVYGLAFLHFDVRPAQVLVTLASVLAVQSLGCRLAGFPRCDPYSALISGISLCLLLRSNSLAVVMLAGFIAIASKFLIRWNGKHVFNPTNLGIAATILWTGEAWISPGQWGSEALTALAVLGCGWPVVTRAERSDVTLTFLLAYPGLLFARAAWLGDPWTIPFHQLSNGAFLIFTFFMISDPKTTPDSRTGRILFALVVAWTAYALRFHWYNPNALVLALAGCSLFVPAVDRLWRDRRYVWSAGGDVRPDRSDPP